MNLFDKDFSLTININLLITIFVIIILISLISKFLIYFPKPNTYIKATNNILKNLYKQISKIGDRDYRNKTVKIFKLIFESLLAIITSFYLFIKIIFLFLARPIPLVAIFFVWFEFVELNVTNTFNLYNFFYIFETNDFFTLNVLNAVITSIKYIAPLSLPFYYFTYREQKTLADSSVNSKSTTGYFLLFLIFSMAALSYSINLREEFTKEEVPLLRESLKLTGIFAEDLALIAIYTFLGVIFFLKTTTDLLGNISLSNLLSKKINEVYFNYYLVSFGKLFFIKDYYRYLSNKVETVYQSLYIAAGKNLGDIYGDSFKKWGKVLDYMLIEYRLGSFDSTTKHLYLLNKYKADHLKLYKTILKNHKNLIIHLVDLHKIEDSKDAIHKFLDWIPSPTQLGENQEVDDYYNRFLSTYYVTLYELLIYLYDNKNIGVYPVLEKIKNESETIEAVEKEGIIRNLQALLIKAVENDDVKMLSTYSYYLINLYNGTNSRPVKKTKYKVEIDDETFEFEVKENDDINKEQSHAQLAALEDNNDELFLGSVFLLLQALLKSIELTNYKSTGFLVKFMITSFNSDVFNTVFTNFYKSPYENKYIPKRKYYKDIDDNFHFNENVKEYLLVKLFILLYAQQKYVLNNNVNFWEVPTKLLDSTLISKSNYLQYMFSKLDNAKHEYGLLFLNDEKFLKKLKIDLGIQDNKQSFYQTLLKKLLDR
jgi:hypothetical protein